MSEAKDLNLEILYAQTAILITHEWVKWSLSSGYCLSFSVFIDNFDAESFIPKELKKYRISSRLYASVKALIATADSEVDRVFGKKDKL